MANGLGCCCFSPALSKSPLRREEKSSEHVAGARLVAVVGLVHNDDDASDRRATAPVVSQWRPRRRRSTRICGNLIIRVSIVIADQRMGAWPQQLKTATETRVLSRLSVAYCACALRPYAIRSYSRAAVCGSLANLQIKIDQAGRFALGSKHPESNPSLFWVWSVSSSACLST